MYIHIYIEYKKCSSYPIKIDELREVFFSVSRRGVRSQSGGPGRATRRSRAHGNGTQSPGFLAGKKWDYHELMMVNNG